MYLITNGKQAPKTVCSQPGAWASGAWGLGTLGYAARSELLMWLLAFEWTVIRLFKKGVDAARILSISVVLLMIMLGITAYYFEFLSFFISWILPNVVMATMVANFVFSMLDKSGNAMAYLLTNLLIGILPYIAFYVLKRNCPVEWMICLLVSFALLVGAIIFRGREVVNEIQRRLSV